MRQSLRNSLNNVWFLVSTYVINLVLVKFLSLKTGVYISLMCLFPAVNSKILVKQPQNLYYLEKSSRTPHSKKWVSARERVVAGLSA